MKAKIFIIAAYTLLAIISGACQKKQEAPTQTPPHVKGVHVASVERSKIDDYYEATGTVRSKTSTLLSSKIIGSIVLLNVHEGDRVRAGQVVIEIDNRDARVQARRAEAGLGEVQGAAEECERNIHAAESAKAAAEADRALAEATFNRYRILLERKSVSPQEFDEVQAKYRVTRAEADRADKMLQAAVARRGQIAARIEQAKAEIANANVSVSYTRIVSPINGLVTAKHAEAGSIATPGTPLLTIEDGSRYRLEAAVEESQLDKIRLGSQAFVVVDALGSEELSGTVTEIAPATDPMSRSCMVKTELPQASKLRSGLYGKVRFPIGQKTAVTVPRQAIVERGQLTGVFVVNEGGIARMRLIKTGKAYGERIEVLSGLDEGEQIVTDDVHGITDGSRTK